MDCCHTFWQWLTEKEIDWHWAFWDARRDCAARWHCQQWRSLDLIINHQSIAEIFAEHELLGLSVKLQRCSLSFTYSKCIYGPFLCLMSLHANFVFYGQVIFCGISVQNDTSELYCANIYDKKNVYIYKHFEIWMNLLPCFFFPNSEIFDCICAASWINQSIHINIIPYQISICLCLKHQVIEVEWRMYASVN